MRYTLYIVVFSLFLLFSCTSGSSIEFPSSPIGQANEFVLDQLSVSVSTPVKVPGDFFDVGDVINVNLNPVNDNPWLVYQSFYLYKVPDSGLGKLVDNPLNGWYEFAVKNTISCFDDENYAYMNLQDETCCDNSCNQVNVDVLDAEIVLPSDLVTSSYLLIFAVGESDTNGEWDLWDWVYTEINVHGEDWCDSVPATCGSGDDQNVLTSCIDNHIVISECEFGCENVEAGSKCKDGCFDASQNPIPLCTCKDLQRVNNHLRSNVEIQNDIDCSDSVNWNKDGEGIAQGFSPLNSYYKIFDGKDHIIRNLYINRPNTNYVGLFGQIDDDGIIRNVGLEEVDIKGKEFVGALIGLKNKKQLSNSFATGSVSGINFIGGLAGKISYGSVSDSYANVDVSGTGDYVGGFVGESYYGTISNSYAIGDVSGNNFVGGLAGKTFYGPVSSSYASGSVNGNSQVGGLVGYSHFESISSSYAIGDVNGNNYIGGLVGNKLRGPVSSSYTSGIVTGSGNYVGGLIGFTDGVGISNSYTSGSVTGNSQVGGLVGYLFRPAIVNSYASGSVNGITKVGGLVGQNQKGSVSSSFWDTERSITTSPGGEGKTTIEMKDQSTYPDTWDFNTVWAISPDVNEGYPYLQVIN